MKQNVIWPASSIKVTVTVSASDNLKISSDIALWMEEIFCDSIIHLPVITFYFIEREVAAARQSVNQVYHAHDKKISQNL